MATAGLATHPEHTQRHAPITDPLTQPPTMYSSTAVALATAAVDTRIAVALAAAAVVTRNQRNVRAGISIFSRSSSTSGTGDGSFRHPSLGELGVGARSFAEKAL